MRTKTRQPNASAGAVAILGRTLGGAAFGAAFGGFLLGVGIFRFVLARLAGTPARGPSAADLQFVMEYVGGFGVAGALVGLLKPLCRTRPGAIVVGVLAAAVVGMAISLISDQDRPGSPSSIDWLFVAFIAVIFGPAFGLKFRSRSSSD